MCILRCVSRSGRSIRRKLGWKSWDSSVERVDFGNGNVAIYLDDPDGNVVELTEIRLLWDGTAASNVS